MRFAILSAAGLLAACAATLDPNYAVQVEAYSNAVRAQQAVAVAYANAEAARYDAMRAIALASDHDTRSMAVLALALGGRGGGDAAAGVSAPAPPVVPESQDARAYKWAALFAAPVATLAQGYFGYQLGIRQSQNATQSAMASYSALSNVAGSGFTSALGIASAGFRADNRIATGAFSALTTLVPQLRPNITISGSGVVGTGTYNGPNSGANSGNSGQIGTINHNGSPETTCSGTTDGGGTAAPGC